MANIPTNIEESVYNVKRWLGVNEAQEGEATLKFGEAAAMRNFRVTAGGALQKRPGSRNVAGLMAAYNVVVDPEQTETLISETGKSTATFQVYPRAVTDSVGNVVADGEPVTVDGTNFESFIGHYAVFNGTVYQLRGRSVQERRQVGGSRVQINFPYGVPIWFCCCDDIIWNGSSWEYVNPAIGGVAAGKRVHLDTYGSTLFLTTRGPHTIADFEAEAAFPGRYATIDEVTTYILSVDGTQIAYSYSVWEERTFSWTFSPTRAEANASDTTVSGIWSGFVGGREVLCAAAGGNLWELEQRPDGWHKTSCGLLDTSQDVHMFGFEEKLYILNGSAYKVWDGVLLSDVEGYRPVVTVATEPAGGGQGLQRVNLLSGARRCWCSPDGTARTFRLPERGLQSVDWVKNRIDGQLMTGYTADLANGTVTFTSAPAKGVDTIEIAWTVAADYSVDLRKMRFAEMFNGAQDTRVFLYGDGTNKTYYSDLDENGNPRADYFPDLNEASVGDENTPVTAMIRHYSRLLCFKLDSAWSIAYDAITLSDGSVTAGFYVSPVNRDVGNCAPGQAALVENQPRTLDGRSVIEWKTAANGKLTDDRRNAQRVSQRVEKTIRTFDLSTARTFYDKITHEYYVIGAGGEALVHNVEADAWYTYTDFPAVCMINYKDEVYYGTADGFLRHFSQDYLSDEGAAIDAYWESGAIDFGADFRRKYSAMLWLGIRPEEAGYLAVTAETDRKSDFAEYSFETRDASAVPTMKRIKLKAKKFTYYKIVLRSDRADTTATVVSADLRVRSTGYVR